MGLFSYTQAHVQDPSKKPSATGGTYVQLADWNVHIFCSTGTLQVTQGGTGFEYLVIGGGGGGGCSVAAIGAGGGGGGGWRCCTGKLVLPGSYIATVGAGGASNTNGCPSCFRDLVAAGGGAGGSGICPAPLVTEGTVGCNGGNGGGAAGQNNLAPPNNGLGNVPSVSPSQGFPGGCACCSTLGSHGGGGGGAGQTGTNGTVDGFGLDLAGNGGSGRISCITGSNCCYGPGGGGGGGPVNYGFPGCNGGGTGSQGNSAGSAGTPNTGGGGGGADGSYPGGCGGSGIVVIRYPR